jgi:hypothetical protein
MKPVGPRWIRIILCQVGWIPVAGMPILINWPEFWHFTMGHVVYLIADLVLTWCYLGAITDEGVRHLLLGTISWSELERVEFRIHRICFVGNNQTISIWYEGLPNRSYVRTYVIEKLNEHGKPFIDLFRF